MTDNSNTFLDIRQVLLRHRRKAGIVFALLFCTAVGSLYVIEPEYQSESSLLVRMGRENASLDPTATTGERITVNDSRAQELNSILNMIASRQIAEKVVDALGADVIFGRTPRSKSSGPSILGSLKNLVDPLPPVEEKEKAIIKLQKSMTIWSPRDSTVVNLRYEAASPKSAQTIIKKYVDIYLGEHVRIHKVAGSFDFFVEQYDLLQQKHDNAMAQLRDKKNDMGVISIEGQRDHLQKLLDNAETNRHRVQADLVASQARRDSLLQSNKELPEDLRTQKLHVPNAGADDMRTKLYELEVLQGEIHATHMPAHPAYGQIAEQIADARRIFENQGKQRTHVSNQATAVQKELNVQLLKERATIESLQKQLQTVEQQRDETLVKMRDLNRNAIEFAKLQHSVDIARTEQLAYAQKREQARINQELENDRISNINIVQAATFESKPTSPRKGLTILIGLLAGIAGAVGIAYLTEWNDHSLRNPHEVEQQLDIPVLLTVPRIHREQILPN